MRFISLIPIALLAASAQADPKATIFTEPYFEGVAINIPPYECKELFDPFDPLFSIFAFSARVEDGLRCTLFSESNCEYKGRVRRINAPGIPDLQAIGWAGEGADKEILFPLSILCEEH